MDFATWVIGARALILLLAFAGFSWALLRMRRESAQQLERIEAGQRALRDELRAEIRSLTERLGVLGTIIAAMPARVERTAEAAPPAAPRREPPVRSYETAKRLARSGATVEEIVATCGVAGTEARLLRRLHGAGPRHEDAA